MYHIYADGASIYDPLNNSYFLFNPKVKLEFGKAGSCEFVISPTNIYYNELKQMKTIITVEEDDGTEIFRGRVLNISRDFNNLKTIYCEGDLAYLVDSVQKAVKYEGTVHELFRKIIRKHNAMVEDEKKFRVGNITIDDRPIKIAGKSEEIDNTGKVNYKQIAIDSIADNWNSTYDYIQSCIIDYCGGYLQTRRQNDHTYIDLWKKHDNVRDAKVTFGVNMLDFTEEANVENDEFCTVLIPLGDENLTIASVNNNSEELVDEALVEEYGRIVRTHVFQNVNNASTLLTDAKRYMKFNEEPPITITVRAIDMHFIDQTEATIHIGDYVKIVSNPHGVSRRLVCTEIEYDLSDPSNTSYTFGNPKQTLTRRYKEDKRKTSESSTAAAGATGGGVGSASAAAATTETEELIADAKDWIYKEWIDLDPDNPDGVGSLGGIYRKIVNDEEVLQKVGISFDAEAGNVNLTALQQKLNDQGEYIDTKIAGVSATVNDGVTEAKLYAENLVSGSRAEIKTYIDQQDNSIISAKADKVVVDALQTRIQGTSETITSIKNTLKHQVGIDVDAQTGNVNISSLAQLVNQQGETISKTSADLNTMSNGLQSQISQVATYTDENRTNIASLTTTANRLGSQINLKADKVTIDADITDIKGRLNAIDIDVDNLKAKKITTNEIEALIANIQTLRTNSIVASGQVVASQFYVGEVSGSRLVVTSQDVTSRLNNITSPMAPGNAHYHTLTENADGTISLGYATSTPQSFKISATKAYQDGVAAAVAAVRVTEITKRVSPVYGTEEHFNPSSHTTSVFLKALSADGTELGTGAVATSTTAWDMGYAAGAEAGGGEGYERGFNNVDITGVYLDGSRSVTHGVNAAGNHYATIPIKASISNNKPDTTNSVATILTQSEFEDGKVAGAQTVKVYAPVRYATDSYSKTDRVTTLKIIAVAENNESSPVATFTTSTAAYDHGDSVGFNRCGFDTSFGQKNTGINIGSSLDIANKKVTVGATGKLTNGKISAYTSSDIDVSAIYASGETNGKKSVGVAVTTSVSKNKSAGTVTVTATAVTVGNPNTKSAVAEEPVSIKDWLDEAETNGKKSVDVAVTTSVSKDKSAGTVTVTATGVTVGNPDTKSVSKTETVSVADWLKSVTVAVTQSVSMSQANKTVTVTANAATPYGASATSKETVSVAGWFSGFTVALGASLKDGTNYSESVAIGNSNVTYTEDSKYVNGRIRIHVTDGTSNISTSIWRVRLSAQKAFTAGQTSATPSIDGPYLQKTTYSGERELYYVQPVVYVNGTPYYGSVEYMSTWRQNGMI